MGGLLAVGMTMVMAAAVAWAADEGAPGTVEAAQVGELTDASRDQILRTIEATRQTDPELAAEMERQFDLMESGQFDPRVPAHDVAGAEAGQRLDGEADPRLIGPPVELIGPPVEGGGYPNEDPRFQEVQSDPRMQAIREGYEAGRLTEDQAREGVFEVLRDHGVEPDNGREWERHEWDGAAPDERLDRAWEHMSPEAREQMERLYEHEGERTEMNREMFEREFGASAEHSFEGPERAYEAPVREYEAPMREYEAPVRESETPERAYEAPEHEYQAPEHEYHTPEPGHESEGPPPPQP
jgi:hypothetical protein